MKPSKVIENLLITGISSDGKSVGREDNRVIFVNQGAPGDLVDVKIVGKQRKFLIGNIEKYHEKSVDRSEPFCEHFGICGGCKWQHLSYAAQLKHKQDQVTQNLRRIGKTDLPESRPILGSEKTRFYRNKLEFTFSNRRWLTTEEIESGVDLERNALGFHIPGRFDKILDISSCWLQDEPSNSIRLAVKKYALAHDLAFFDLNSQTGFLRNLIVRTSTTGDLMVIVQFFENNEPEIKKLMDFLKKEFPEISSLQYIINPKKNETFFDLPVHIFHGKPFIEEQMEDLRFRIGPKSFYQTNSWQALELYKIVREFANLTGDELVYDLYTGTGTIANFIASRAKKVVGIESVEDAVIDARKNSEVNGITNTSFFFGDMKDLLSPSFVEQQGRPDVIITDPPRAGMHANVVEQINQIRPKRLVYVSCNPATQARDLELLSEVFEVQEVQPVDMFPQTHHVENVLLLKLK